VKIAIVRSRYTPFGGAERFVERALGALLAQGAEVTLIARSWAGGSENLAQAGFKQIVCDPPYSKLGGRTARDASFARAVQGEMARGGYDIVQSH
jgi:UDP-glucose:(heptosyl)LPS alpha-1,3-glucosyltransferase